MKNKTLVFLLLGGLLCLSMVADLCLGSIHIPFRDVWRSLFDSQSHEVFSEVVRHYRLPKCLMAVLAGSALSVSGMMMQCLFRNPLAGPDVLGVNAGATMGVALVTMLSSCLGSYVLPLGSWSLVVSAVVGALLVLLLVLWVSSRLPDVVSLLIVGMMFGYVAGSVVSMLQSISHPDSLKLFVVWTFGSLSSVSWSMLPALLALYLPGMLLAIWMVKPMNALMLGEAYARSLGVSVGRTRFGLILSTALLTGGVTAFAGPISFVGITVPHIAKGLLGSWNHRCLLPACFLFGACLMLVCDVISQRPVFHAGFPINAVTALVGSPVIVWILLKRNK